MKKLLLTLALLTPSLATAEGYVLGAGRWTCAEVVRISDSGSSSEIGQFAGWLFGFWSAATFSADTSFVDIVENAGGRAIMDATIAECRKASGDTMVFEVAQSMIRNTG